MLFSLGRNVCTFCKRSKKLTFQLFTTIFSFYSSETISRLFRFHCRFFTKLQSKPWQPFLAFASYSLHFSLIYGRYRFSKLKTKFMVTIIRIFQLRDLSLVCLLFQEYSSKELSEWLLPDSLFSRSTYPPFAFFSLSAQYQPIQNPVHV